MRLFPNLGSAIQELEDSQTFSFIIGGMLWLIVCIISFFHFVQWEGSRYHIVNLVFALSVLILFGCFGAVLNKAWSVYINTNEPVVQLICFLIQLAIYVLPVFLFGWQKSNGAIDGIDIIVLTIESCSMVILRVIYSQVVRPLAEQRIKCNQNVPLLI